MYTESYTYLRAHRRHMMSQLDLYVITKKLLYFEEDRLL
jgi:hypothetical protein